MRDIIAKELTQAAQEIFQGFAHLLPRLIVMLVIVFVGWVPPATLGRSLARGAAGHGLLAAGDGGIRLVCAEYRQLQRALSERRDQYYAAGVDVPDVADRAAGLRIQCGV